MPGKVKKKIIIEIKTAKITLAIIVLAVIRDILAIFRLPYSIANINDAPMIATLLLWTFNIIAVACIMIFSKNTYLKFKLKDLKLDLKSVRSSFALGIASFFAKAATAFAAIITTILVNKLPGSLESIKENGISILQQLSSSMTVWVMFMMAIIIGISQGAQTILAYAYGAKKYNRIWQILKRVAIVEFVWLLLCLILIIAFAFPKEKAWEYRWFVVLNFASIHLATVTYISYTLFQSIKKSLVSLTAIALRSFVVVLVLAGIGYALDYSTGVSELYFIFIGLTDLVSGLLLIPLLLIYWKLYRGKLVDHPDDFTHLNEKEKV